jgi:pectate lyase
VSFFDDFEDGDLMGWVSSAIGSSTAFTNVVDGTTRVLEAVNPAGDDPLFAAGNVGWTDQAVEARVKLTAGSATVARIFLCARLRDLDNYYFLYLEDDEIIVRRMQSGSSTTLTRVQVPGGTVALGTWYRLRLVVQGSTVTGFVDGTATPSYVDAVPITNGGIAVGVSEEATAHFDDVRVTPPP